MTKTSRKICVVTGTRAEYGLLRWVIQGIQDSELLELQLIVTGMHLSPEFGLTVREIEADGFRIDRKVEMLLSSDTPVGITKSMGLGLIGFADVLNDLRPDLLFILGDRYEIMAAAISAMIRAIPIAHCHGGEKTEGAFDEAIRHSITKMSHLHFVATEEYRQRVIQLGETPDRVTKVGGLGIENILRLQLLSRTALETKLGFNFLKKNILITFHPVTLEVGSASHQLQELLLALSELIDTRLIFTMPNSDTESRSIVKLINHYCHEHPNAYAFTSLGQLCYLSCLQYVDCVVGNSSSGLLEVPSFKKGTLNIGYRQEGRLRATSVIDCAPELNSIREGLTKSYTSEFQSALKSTVNPYGDQSASKIIVDCLETSSFQGLTKKSFHDL